MDAVPSVPLTRGHRAGQPKTLEALAKLKDQPGLSLREIGDWMGWTPERVGHIRKVYVDGSKVVVAIGRLISERQSANRLANQSDGE